MSAVAFHCENPDFTVQSVPDGDLFGVRRDCLIRGSEVLRDMFACCSPGYLIGAGPNEDTQRLEINESASTLSLLFHLLHSVPELYVASKAEKDFGRIQEIIPEATIPFPLLPSLYRLADKYVFSQDIMQALHSHLGAYVSMYPLRVYGYASELGLDKVAAKASTHLLHPPLTSYSTEEMKAIPTAEAYHKLALLHEFRTRKIRETLMNEEVFPHGYGECSRHAQRTKDLWKTRKHVVYNQIQAATDAAAEMVSLGEQPVVDCQSCSKAWNAAVAMLSYKCARIPRRIDKLPTEVPAG